jgi:hypothetical protein
MGLSKFASLRKFHLCDNFVVAVCIEFFFPMKISRIRLRWFERLKEIGYLAGTSNSGLKTEVSRKGKGNEYHFIYVGCASNFGML